MKPLNRDEIEKMRIAGKLAARALENVGKYVKAGISTEELDAIAKDFTLSHGAVPAPLGYRGFPKSICTSINECICHGVPGEQILKEGDIINIDITCIKDGFHGDTSSMFVVGSVSTLAQDLIQTALEARERGIFEVKAGATTGDVGFAINKIVTKRGFFPVKEIGGHGIGRKFHDDPFVPSFGKKGRGDVLRAWTCITIEPMINQTAAAIVEHDIPGSEIKWYETADRSLSAQFEHTVLITDSGHEILTQP